MGWSGQTFPIKGVNEMDFLCFASSGTISTWNASFGTFIFPIFLGNCKVHKIVI